MAQQTPYDRRSNGFRDRESWETIHARNRTLDIRPLPQTLSHNGFFSLYPAASTISSTASSHYLEISYPSTTQEGTNSFQFMLSGIPPSWNLAGNVVDGF